MNYKDYLARLSTATGLDQKQAGELVEALAQTMGDELEEGSSLLVPGFGTFEVKKRTERVITVPATNAKMLIPPRLTLSFKPSPALKDRY